ncbi:unnamed protein product, partial [Mesorhabditis spiculigera]
MLIFIRRGGFVDAEKELSDQMQLLVERDGDKLAPVAEKALNEAEVSLLHLQQNIDIPEINLVVNQHILAAIQAQGRKAKADDLGNMIEDSLFLNTLQSGVGRWIKEIQKVTKLERDPASGFSLQEMNFWLNLEPALQKMQEKRECEEIQLTLEVLKAGKRFHATVSFDSDTALREAIGNVFGHLKKLRVTKYPIARALRLIEAISRDVNAQMSKILSIRRLMHISMKEFDQLMNDCFKEQHSDARETVKKKREETLRLTFKPNLVHKKLEQRLAQIKAFRRQHEQFRTVIERVLRCPNAIDGVAQLNAGAGTVTAAPTAVEQIDRAYEYVKEVDCLDVTAEGTVAYDAAQIRYEQEVQRVETDITAWLRGQLGAAKNAKEMFSIFSRYNALFVRPNIRGAIREYQTQLIDKVKENIAELQEIFATKYNDNYRHEQLTKRLDIQPLSCRIIFVKNIENKLNDSMKRVEDVLGKGWEGHVDGQQLKKESDMFRQRLNIQPMYDDWVKSTKEKNLSASGKLLTIDKRNQDGKPVLQLKVNFRDDMIQLHKEVRYLKTLGQRIPLQIVNAAHQAAQMNPNLSGPTIVEKKLADRKDIETLIASSKKEVQMIIAESLQLNWDSCKLEQYVTRFNTAVSKYSEKCEELFDIISQIDGALAALDSCPYTMEKITEQLRIVQENVDVLALGSYSNLQCWSADLDKNIEQKLSRRLEEAMRIWALVYNKSPPSIEQVRARLCEQLFEWQAVVTAQKRISRTRCQLAMNADNVEATYKDIFGALLKGLTTLEAAYKTVDAVMTKVEEYVGEWMCYQALWDLQAEVLYDSLGDDLTRWMRTLDEIRKNRRIFDTTDARKDIYPVVIDYTKVQGKVSSKYDNWHKEVLQKFSAALGQEMQTFHGQVSKWRSDLEGQSVDSGSTTDADQLITYVQGLKKQTKIGQDQVDKFRAAQRLLNQQRFQFPNQWLYAEHAEGEWDALQDLLLRKDSAIQSQVANLQTKIKEEDELVEKRTIEALQDWERSKPVEGGQRPAVALEQLAAFEQRLCKLRDDRDKMKKARLALDLAETTGVPTEADKLSIAVEELGDLKGVWEALKPVYSEIDEIKEKTWLSVQPRKLRQNLDELSQRLKGLPVKYKTYQSYEKAKDMLQSYGKVNLLIAELKSEALKERHWRQLMKELRVTWNLQDLTLGQVWDADVQRHEAAIKNILTVAQGENALEEFLKQLREYWLAYEVELINYQNKTRIIKGWDDLFNKLKEHQNSLAAMKLSAYYKPFEEDALSWEDKLNKISSMFDVWIDVQRRWVYLDGLFSGSAEIASLMPNESSRFSSISAEFLGLMKKVIASPRILDIDMMQGAQRLLERLAEMLAKIQKALGEYLERERSSFPRFDFVGDEDLLEIMGNSKDISRLQKHLKKMFAGVTAVTITEEDKRITEMHSREGETVVLSSPVATQGVRINEWLHAVEKEMRTTLAKFLSNALKDFAMIDVDTVSHASYMEFLDKYPCQLIGLVAEIWWSNQMENALQQEKDAAEVEKVVSKTLALLADNVLKEQPPIRRRKIEMLITELVHKRNTSRRLLQRGVTSTNDFEWAQAMRTAWRPRKNAALSERLVRTPLTDRCFLTMTQALHSRLGGSPFGPAGTGKTESVKALGHQLGRFVLVFNCDETFDFQAMGRILVGLCQPDRQLIAQVMLFSQGFRTAEVLANKIVPLFILCKEQLSAQCHYDFGLRALKYVLVSAGNIKREKLNQVGAAALEDVAEQQMLIQSVCETMVPKLVNEDIALLFSLLSDVFPSIQYAPNEMTDLREKLSEICSAQMLCYSNRTGELGSAWVEKVLQLYQITNLNHGLMLVGPSGTGKTTAWKMLLKALDKLEGGEGVAHVIDAKAMSKDFLYGWMDQNTREWTDGLFTSIVRKIIDNVRGELDKRQWIIFDGDVDPEWVENLNSVLDDNKLLTLPNGERLAIPSNVADLQYATLATVSRCGMVWFSEEVVSSEMLFSNYLKTLTNISLETESAPATIAMTLQLQKTAAEFLQQHFSADGLVPLSLRYALTNCEHIMVATSQRLLSSFFAMMNYSIRVMVQANAMREDIPFSHDQVEAYVARSMLANIVWAFSGDGRLSNREALSEHIRKSTTLPLPPNAQAPIIDYEVTLTGEWRPWIAKVPKMEIETHRVAAADLVVPTVDTVRHEMLFSAWLSEHKPLVLCGPPGSGKTMTLLAALRSQPDMGVVNVNFSSSTTPELLMRTFDHYCGYRRTPNGVVLAPSQLGRWLVIFCDEIAVTRQARNAASYLNGFYRTSDHSWVSLERIQFVGACNPPTDPGRHPMTLRFLRHVPVVYVDYPGKPSLEPIYGTFNFAMLRMAPACRSIADALTAAMVEVYLASQKQFTQDQQPHYVYSPRELTRWVRGICEAIAPLDKVKPEDIVRLWAHEALRLFQDRLVTEEERNWTDDLIDSTAEKYFAGVNVKTALKRPILYSCWLSKQYLPVTQEALRQYVKERLKVFYEEELDVRLVLYYKMLDHVLRIDRIYRQQQGHLLLIGTSGSGKTTLSRFVA